jgi:ribonuclease HIII
MDIMAQPFVTTLDTALEPKLRLDLEQQGFILSTPPHTLFAAKKKGVSCTLYCSGKLVVQGKEMAEFIEFYLEPEVLGEFSFSYKDLNVDKTPRIGIDESGKGDFFGPLCIAGVYASEDDIDKLLTMGVCDSKKLNDKKILTLSDKICSSFAYHVVRLFPEKYNELYVKFYNLNHLLAWGHATVIENLIEETQCNNVLIDQFAAKHVVERALKQKKISPKLQQRHKAEEDPVVAAASIVARAAFVKGIQSLGEEYSIILPKGASKMVIAAGKKLVAQHTPEILKKTGKLHFKTRDDILS